MVVIGILEVLINCEKRLNGIKIKICIVKMITLYYCFEDVIFIDFILMIGFSNSILIDF